MGRLLEAALQLEFQEPILFLHGGTPKLQRDRIIEQFQRGAPAIGGSQDPDGDDDWDAPANSFRASADVNSEANASGIFILSLKAGGIGLNLTAANHVFHFDRWWNPAVENQATDRAFRIGQTKHVQVHKFVTLGTLEERIDEMIERKQGLSQQIVGAGEQWITEMSTDELRDLFTLRRQWIEA
jgi:SNF2 family DNA or RNA helicase